MISAKAIRRVQNGKVCSGSHLDCTISISGIAASSAVPHTISAVVFATVSKPYISDAHVFVSKSGS